MVRVLFQLRISSIDVRTSSTLPAHLDIVLPPQRARWRGASPSDCPKIHAGLGHILDEGNVGHRRPDRVAGRHATSLTLYA